MLGGFAGSLVALQRLPLLNHPAVSLALYGALHASALVLALRSTHPLWRRVLFISLGASSSLLALCVGLAAYRVIGSLPDGWGLSVPLGLASVSGALTYGILIRVFWIPSLAPGQLVAISLGCLLATLAAYFTLSHSTLPGRWWLAVWWWGALSAGLWWCDRRKPA